MFFKRLAPYFSYLKPVCVPFVIGILFGIVSAVASGAGLPFVAKYMLPRLTGESGGSSLFVVGDFVDLTSFAIKLKQATDPVSEYVKSQLESSTQTLLSDYDGTIPPPEVLQDALIEGLNELLRGSSIYDENCFANVTLREKTEKLRVETRENVIRLNRLLLEDAYPQEIVKNRGGPKGLDLLLILGTIPLVFNFRTVCGFMNSYLMAFSGMSVLERLRLTVFGKIQQLPLGFFQKNRTGDIMSRVMGDTAQLQAALVKVVNSLIVDPVTLLSAIGWLIYLTVKESEAIFMLIALASVPCCVLPIRAIGGRILQKSKLAQAQAGELTHVLNENLSAVREIRSYNLEKREIHRFSEAIRKLFKLNLKTVKYDKALSPLIELVASIAFSLALYVTIIKQVEPSTIISMAVALYMCYDPVKKLGTVSNTIQKAEASLERLEYILHVEDTVPEPENPKPLGTVAGRITFDNVTFAYESAAALNQVTAVIEPGQVVALVGPSGAGKTTFANLVPRFYDVAEGAISLDGLDVREISKQELRSKIALVSQESLLFSDTIANNIRIGKPDATLDEVKQAAKIANAHEFIEGFEESYETIVGERGSRLSGGQRQRIAIARALLKDAPIIILDEPTSALDAESEHSIQAALEVLAKGRTMLIIAHRFSTIKDAECIFVFESGRIIAQGSHEALYSNNSLYTKLYDKQVGTGSNINL